MRKYNLVSVLLVTVALAFGIAGCSSAPTEEEMAQLEALKTEVGSLQKQVDAKKAEKASLEKQIAEKQSLLDAELKEQAATKQRLESQK
jgi:septal ring factor EnvC (AmiA/AmiB activator)